MPSFYNSTSHEARILGGLSSEQPRVIPENRSELNDSANGSPLNEMGAGASAIFNGIKWTVIAAAARFMYEGTGISTQPIENLCSFVAISAFLRNPFDWSAMGVCLDNPLLFKTVGLALDTAKTINDNPISSLAVLFGIGTWTYMSIREDQRNKQAQDSENLKYRLYADYDKAAKHLQDAFFAAQASKNPQEKDLLERDIVALEKNIPAIHEKLWRQTPFNREQVSDIVKPLERALKEIALKKGKLEN